MGKNMVRRPPGGRDNELLIAARKARGLRRAQAARALESWAYEHGHTSFTCSEDKYRTWEYGAIPHAYAWPVLTGFFDKSAAELGLTGSQPCTGSTASPTVTYIPADASAQEDDVLRRRFVTTAPAVALASLMPAPGTRQQPVSVEEIHQIREAVGRLQTVDDQVGGKGLREIAGRYLAQGYELLERPCQASVERELHATLGQAAAWAAWFAHDAGDQPGAHSHLTEALYLAQLAEDPDLQAQILNYMSLQAHACHRAREALRVAKAGQRTAAGLGHPRMIALFHAREALAQARLGGSDDARAALTRAWAAMDDDAAQPTPPWLTFFNTGELRSIETLCATDLGAYRSAASDLESVTAVVDPFARNRALRTARLARVRLALGEVDGACEAGDAALVGAAGSGRVREVLAGLASDLSAHRASRAATTFTQRWGQMFPAAHHA